MWEAKVVAAADVAAAAATATGAAETNWKHKVTPDRGDLIVILKDGINVNYCYVINLPCHVAYLSCWIHHLAKYFFLNYSVVNHETIPGKIMYKICKITWHKQNTNIVLCKQMNGSILLHFVVARKINLILFCFPSEAAKKGGYSNINRTSHCYRN